MYHLKRRQNIKKENNKVYVNQSNYLDVITERIKNLTHLDDFDNQMIQCEKNRRNRYYVYFEQQQMIHNYQWKKALNHNWEDPIYHNFEDEKLFELEE